MTGPVRHCTCGLLLNHEGPHRTHDGHDDARQCEAGQGWGCGPDCPPPAIGGYEAYGGAYDGIAAVYSDADPGL